MVLMPRTNGIQHQPTRRRLLIGAAISCTVPVLSRASIGPAALIGAGATLPAGVYDKWGQRFSQATGMPFRYAALGSGQSWRLMMQGNVNFGATEIPHDKQALLSQRLIEFPVANAAIVLVANLPGVASNQLRLTPELVYQIYVGRIRHWRDPAILKLNDNIVIPDLSITPVSRSGRSGTTLALSRFLSANDEGWQKEIGLTAEAIWSYGLLAKGTYTLEGILARTPGAIGYLVAGRHLSSALSMLALGNAELGFYKSPVTTSEVDDWPLTTPTYAILRSKPSSPFDLAAFEYLRSGMTAWQDSTRQAGLSPLTKNQEESVQLIWQQHGLIG